MKAMEKKEIQIIKRYKKRGFTMIEATIAMILLAIAAAGVLLPFANAAAVQAEGARQTLASNLASEMMEKVQLSDPNDIIAGFEGYTESSGSMLDTKGDVLTDSIYEGFSRSVSCQTATVASVELVAVTVSVYYENREMTRITSLVSKN